MWFLLCCSTLAICINDGNLDLESRWQLLKPLPRHESVLTELEYCNGWTTYGSVIFLIVSSPGFHTDRLSVSGQESCILIGIGVDVGHRVIHRIHAAFWRPVKTDEIPISVNITVGIMPWPCIEWYLFFFLKSNNIIWAAVDDKANKVNPCYYRRAEEYVCKTWHLWIVLS